MAKTMGCPSCGCKEYHSHMKHGEFGVMYCRKCNWGVMIRESTNEEFHSGNSVKKEEDCSRILYPIQKQD